ncbi:unnamed protein product [Lactuca virosa]|uniref:Uncharacterized protein n=1 Tax=Lactuca virosa TaxID=75947 RepID=A0AAU9PVF5_9ASTR|nr:unnamed protein product [Lactuca virosa]
MGVVTKFLVHWFFRVLSSLGLLQKEVNILFLRLEIVGKTSLLQMLKNKQVDAVVYLVDASDRDRFPESRRELEALLSYESLANVPFLILGDKTDIPNVALEYELHYYIHVQWLITGNVR